MFWAVLGVVTLLSVIACHIIAARRGVRPVFWGTMGFLFGPLAIPFALRSKPRHERSDERLARDAANR